MIDICFSDSVGGMLKLVRKEIHSEYVLPLWLRLNYANLDGDVLENQVRREIETAKYFTKTVTENELKEEYTQLLDEERNNHKKLKEFFVAGKSFRLWLSNTANDHCGLFWFCSLIRHCTNNISIVWCPNYEYDRRTNISSIKTDWAMFDNPNLLVNNIDNAQILCKAQIDAYAREWDRIATENAKLRILIDNRIVSVDEDFFDSTILGFVGHTPEKQVHIMGKMLGKWRGCDVAFISERIDHLIATKQIIVCKEEVDEFDCYGQRSIALT